MFENAKNVSKLCSKSNSNQDVIEGITNQNAIVGNEISIVPLIEKPCLPKREYENQDETQQTMSGMLYNYQHLNSPLW